MSLDKLSDLQSCFQAHVLHGDTGMLAQVSSDVRPNASTRLAIYANAYRLRLLEALRTDYPALHTLTGDDYFEQIGLAYIDAYPSTHFSIRHFGQHMAAFLAHTAPYNETPMLAEMATLEWALSLAFDAADDPVLTEASLAALAPAAWPGMRLRFHASMQQPVLHWNVAELWTAIDQQAAPIAPALYVQAHSWVIWRRDMQSYFRPLDDNEAWALNCLHTGADFAALCDGLSERIEAAQVGLQAATYLKGWVQAGLIAEIDC